MAEQNSPLWHLEQQVKAAEQAIISYQADVDRFTRLIAENIKRRDNYQAAIDKIKS